MAAVIKILKLVVAVAFLGLAYLFLTDNNLFGLRPEILVIPVGIAAVAVIYFDLDLKRKANKNRSRKKGHDPDAS